MIRFFLLAIEDVAAMSILRRSEAEKVGGWDQ